MCTLEATFPKFSPQALHPTPVSVASLSTMVNFHNPVVIEKDFCDGGGEVLACPGRNFHLGVLHHP
jgi:hypothetical protein